MPPPERARPDPHRPRRTDVSRQAPDLRRGTSSRRWHALDVPQQTAAVITADVRVSRSQLGALQLASVTTKHASVRWPITVFSADSALSLVAHTATPANTRSSTTQTSARTLVLPSSDTARSAGVEPTLTVPTSKPVPRSACAARVQPRQSGSAMAANCCGVFNEYELPACVITSLRREPQQFATSLACQQAVSYA